MPRNPGYMILFVLLGLISALGGILGNIATNALPKAWEPYLWLASFPRFHRYQHRAGFLAVATRSEGGTY